jgi:IclR family mhp operon transcriptional activator
VNASAASELELRTILGQARQRGYATRDPLHSWPDRSKQLVLRDGRRSMGVPIIVAGSPVASINITWPARRVADEEAVTRHLDALQATARKIGQILDVDVV